MKCQVAFFPIKHIPSQEELDRLDRLQAEFKFAWQTIEHQEKENKFMEVVRKQKISNRLRDSITLIKGEGSGRAVANG